MSFRDLANGVKNFFGPNNKFFNGAREDAASDEGAAGVDLDTATKSVEGIANACATAGINATDAQRAFYNLSQAYSTGSLKYTDYRRINFYSLYY